MFIGEITAVNTKRSRSLYTVLYEDGDGEDMNDREYKEARELYEEIKGLSSKKVVTQTELGPPTAHQDIVVYVRQEVVVWTHRPHLRKNVSRIGGRKKVFSAHHKSHINKVQPNP